MPKLTNVNVTSNAFEYYWDIQCEYWCEYGLLPRKGCVGEVMNRHWCFG